jgi:hypothetical protein
MYRISRFLVHDRLYSNYGYLGSNRPEQLGVAKLSPHTPIHLKLSRERRHSHSDRRGRNTRAPAQPFTDVRYGSVLTCQHSNLHGEYDFSDEKLRKVIA